MATGVNAIDRLRLSDAFATGTNCPFDECWTISADSELMVVDDDTEKCSRFSNDKDEERKALIVINKCNKEIVLLSIDNKLIANHQGGIADCALFDEEQFRFVEFKTNAYGNSEKAVRGTFDKATSQLKNTIQLFADRLKQLNISIVDVIDLSCHVVVSHSFPKSKAVKQEYQLAFTGETGLRLDFSEKTYWNK